MTLKCYCTLFDLSVVISKIIILVLVHDNANLCLYNSRYPAQPHSAIVYSQIENDARSIETFL